MSDNIRLEDLLALLASMGTISLTRTRFPGAGSPELVGQPVLWKAELRVPGYKGMYGQPTMITSGRDALATVAALYEKAEDYFASDESKNHRTKYEDDQKRNKERWESLPEYARRWEQRPRTVPLPDVRDPSTPSIDKEVFFRG